MKQFRKILALIISLAVIVTVIPAMSTNLKTKAADTFAITSPEANELKAAGYIDIEWTAATSSTVKNYELYIDDKLITTTTGTSYEYYTTKVKAFDTYVKANFTNGNSITTEEITFGVSKKGLGLATDMGANISLRNMGVAWYYNWGESPSSGDQYTGIEYVPMVWKETNANNFKTRVERAKSRGYKYILTFNEPDLAGQCNMSVGDVYNVWQGIEGMDGIKISSPVTALWPMASPNWFQTFMTKVDENGDYKPDFISIHCYPDNYGGAAMAKWFLEEVVDWTWETYHLPIWITEFSTTGGSITATGGNGTKEFWENVMPGLDSREYVERYAAFGFNSATTGLWLYNTGELTPGGEVYSQLGNPEGFEAAVPPEPDYKVTTEKRNQLISNTKTINNVVCEDYVNASGVTVTSDSEIGNAGLASFAIDNDVNSRWESKHGVDPVSLTIDLGSVKNIKEVDILWENASASNYNIEVSTDGANWTPVAEGITGNGGRCDMVTLKNQVSARYVKIYCVSRSTNYGYSIYDMAIFGTDNTKVDETTTPAPTTPKPTTTAAPTEPSDVGKKLEVLNGASFTGYVGSWANSRGSVTADVNGDATIKIKASGGGWADAIWGIQAQYKMITVVPGNTYKYTATIRSDKDKKITIKTSPSGVDEPLVQDVITLKAGVTYTYEAEFVATSTSVDIVYAFGSPAGEASVQNANITIKENDLVVTKEVVTTPSVEETTAESQADKVTTTKKLGKTKVTKATKKKASKKVKITLKRIKGAQKYQLQISTTKKFKKKLIKRTVKRVKTTITSSRIKNKKKLYVRARAMKIVGKKKFYGSWSKPKRVKERK